MPYFMHTSDAIELIKSSGKYCATATAFEFADLAHEYNAAGDYPRAAAAMHMASHRARYGWERKYYAHGYQKYAEKHLAHVTPLRAKPGNWFTRVARLFSKKEKT